MYIFVEIIVCSMSLSALKSTNTFQKRAGTVRTKRVDIWTEKKASEEKKTSNFQTKKLHIRGAYTKDERQSDETSNIEDGEWTEDESWKKWRWEIYI